MDIEAEEFVFASEFFGCFFVDVRVGVGDYYYFFGNLYSCFVNFISKEFFVGKGNKSIYVLFF